MSLSKPIAALAAGCLLMSVAALAQTGGGRPRRGGRSVHRTVRAGADRLDRTVGRGRLREGVIQSMELQIGMPVKKDGTIGILHHEMAELTVRKNKLQADSTAPTEKAEAQKEVAVSVVARNKRLNERKAGMVSAEDVAKAEGELKVAEAQVHEAKENREIADADLKLAIQTLKEHTIVAPVRRRHHQADEKPGRERACQRGGRSARQSLQASRQRLCSARFCVSGQGGPGRRGSAADHRQGKGEPLPIEKKRFRGKITFIDPQIQPVAETAVRIRAEFENPDGRASAGNDGADDHLLEFRRRGGRP